ncbi:ABC transporter substrate-binding protein [Liquorilactobacillus cacaonum]|uniref:Spermidine putrescine ABC transporter substrate-binding protein n=1 Tax=Liquorilactobacillus cacaonum DSM 21116 TaxID=1423729 RepID=A0A0R2CVJ3_9LACO|nr:ABC transporter substrate-binding protein [Liquorilactobacillus cacaonum]KRM91948.1 spermidine putrescine ABC transporter substrate-binding protein [Liquorilactobacillus cacaonum DSM 21116]
MRKSRKLKILAAGLIFAGALAIGNVKADAKQITVSTFGLSTKQMTSDILNPFTKVTGIKTKTQFGDSAQRFTQIEHNTNSGVDVIELSQNNALSGKKKNLFTKLNTGKLKNFKYLSSSEQKLAKETNSVPYTVNSVGIIYNPKKVKITSWNQLWSKKLRNKIAIPDMTTTFGPAMLYIAGDYAKTSVTKDGGNAAFKAIKSLKPNVVKTYTQSSDLTNMFKTGEIDVAVVGDYAVQMVKSSNTGLKYFVPKSGTYANYDTVSIVKGSKNTTAAYKYIDYRISKAAQKKVAGLNSLNNAPVNTKVKLTKKESEYKTYGAIAKRAKTIDFSYVNSHLAKWITKWNSIMND